MKKREVLAEVTRKRASRTGASSSTPGAAPQRGGVPGNPGGRPAVRLRRLSSALAEVMPPGWLARWLQTPNRGLGGLKPIELLDRGDFARLQRMIYELRSGVVG